MLVMLSWCGPALAATETGAMVEQPRPFGHVVGDVIVQRVLLMHGGRAIEPLALPPLVREGVWFERRAARIETLADGRRWLVLEYQIINAPRDQAIARLPAWSVQSSDGDVVLKVPEWPLTVQALAPEPAAPDGAPALRPDRPARAWPSTPCVNARSPRLQPVCWCCSRGGRGGPGATARPRSSSRSRARCVRSPRSIPKRPKPGS
jgi:hypothetical protein